MYIVFFVYSQNTFSITLRIFAKIFLRRIRKRIVYISNWPQIYKSQNHFHYMIFNKNIFNQTTANIIHDENLYKFARTHRHTVSHHIPQME